MRFKAHALPPPPRSTRTRGAAAAATPPTPQKTRQPQNRKEPEPRPSLVLRPTPRVVVEDRTRHTTYTRDLGNGLTLGGSWAAKEARLLELEEANASLQARCALAEARAEAPSAQNERLRLRGQLRAAQENSRMANEDALAAHFVKKVYTSALPVAYGHAVRSEWAPFARLVLRAAYDGTYDPPCDMGGCAMIEKYVSESRVPRECIVKNKVIKHHERKVTPPRRPGRRRARRRNT